MHKTHTRDAEGFTPPMVQQQYGPGRGSNCDHTAVSSTIVRSFVRLSFRSLFFSSQNVLENYPIFLMLLAVSSINRPHIAAALGAIRLLGFVLYVKGYQVGKRTGLL